MNLADRVVHKVGAGLLQRLLSFGAKLFNVLLLLLKIFVLKFSWNIQWKWGEKVAVEGFYITFLIIAFWWLLKNRTSLYFIIRELLTSFYREIGWMLLCPSEGRWHYRKISSVDFKQAGDPKRFENFLRAYCHFLLQMCLVSISNCGNDRQGLKSCQVVWIFR